MGVLKFIFAGVRHLIDVGRILYKSINVVTIVF